MKPAMHNLALVCKGPKMGRHLDCSSEAPDQGRRVEPKRGFHRGSAPKIDPNEVSSLHLEGAPE